MTNFKDQAPLIKEIKNIVSKNNFLKYSYDNGQEALRLDFKTKKDHNIKPYLVSAEKTALELGSPYDLAFNSLLWTKRSDLLKDRIWVSGSDFRKIKKSPIPFAYLLVFQIPESFDPTDPNFKSNKNLSNKIPGLMTRSLPGKMWIRLHQDLIKNNFSLFSLGQCLVFSFKEKFPELKGFEIFIISENLELIMALESIHKRALLISSENSKLVLEENGLLSCEDFNCSVCSEKEACDTIREAIRKKKS